MAGAVTSAGKSGSDGGGARSYWWICGVGAVPLKEVRKRASTQLITSADNNDVDALYERRLTQCFRALFALGSCNP